MLSKIQTQKKSWSNITIFLASTISILVVFITVINVHMFGWIVQTRLQQTVQAFGDSHDQKTDLTLNAASNFKLSHSQKPEEIIIHSSTEKFHKIFNFNYIERSVPKGVSRFDYPWRMFHPISNKLALKQSRGRLFYSTTGDYFPAAGLGHSMLITNAEVSTSLRLNLTYTHRIARQPLRKQSTEQPVSSAKDPFPHHIGSVEEFFGWGVGEHPRQQVQISICTKPGLRDTLPVQKCGTICNGSQYRFLNQNNIHNRSDYPSLSHSISVSNIVEIPERLHAQYPNRETMKDKQLLVDFTTLNNLTNTAFVMPNKLCNRFPSRYITILSERSFFFYKYWQSHGLNGVHLKNDDNLEKVETFDNYIFRTIKDNQIKPVQKRPTLHHLKDRAINIAIHARRGDFIHARRKMVSVDSYISILEQLFAQVIASSNQSHPLPLSITFYSEGRILSKSKYANHNTAQMSKEFLDADGTVINQTDVKNRIMQSMIKKNKEYAKNSSISFRISENTIICVHEMVASDIFIGSGSTLSTSVVGSLSRAAFLLVPGTYKDNYGKTLAYSTAKSDTALEDNGRIMVFEESSGQIRGNEIETIKILWERFRKRHPALFNFKI